MIQFERRNPFPLHDSFSKSEALAHAADCDSWLGLRVEEIEARLALGGSSKPAPVTGGGHQQLWFGLAPRDLQTPYLELRRLLETVGGSGLVVDLGAAYARMAFVIERHFPEMSFVGFEYVGERVAEARRALTAFGAVRSRVDHVDLTSPTFKMPAADVYFIYDYGTPVAIEKTLYDLRRATQGRLVTVVARGRVCRYAIESRHSSWLMKRDASLPESAVTVYRSLLGLGLGADVEIEVDRIEPAVENRV
jgi:hypothetical protein